MTAYIDAHRLVLQGLNERKLFKLMDVSDTEFIQFLQKIGLLNSKKTCDGCGEQMFDRWRKKRNDRYRIWRCYKHGCKKEKGFFVGTFFEGAKLEPKQVFWILYKWSRGYTKQKDLIFESTRESGKREGKSLSSSTIVDWLNFCRDIAAIWCSSYNSKIGGPAKIVEIDETVITKRKYNRGRLVKEQIWLFGGVERGGTACFLVMLVDYNGNSLPRNAATLLPIIQRYVIPGSTIMSDCWPAYGGIQNLPEAYQYLKVNHTYNFVDPDTGAHTQTIESTWQKLKQKHKERYGTNRKLFGTYIVEFLFRRKFNGPDMLYHMCQFITKHYPVEIDERMITVPKENAEADVPNQSLGFLEDLDFDPNNPEHVEDVMEHLEDDSFEFMDVDEFFADDYQVEEFNFENLYE
uniref:ISXO2-like transposase domain-containing protein n=1 Tax=Acrobeloides nanus TaxID=290746 RepID=A0A914CQ65_9BILA